MPKPLPAKHPDRFSPGGVPEAPAGADSESADDSAAPDSGAAKPETPKQQGKAQSAPQTAPQTSLSE